jgi:hypothetical protein
MLEQVESVFFNTDHFAESVTLHGDTDVTVTALIDLGSVIADPQSEEVPELTGFLTVKTSDSAAVQAAQYLTMRGQRFHINGNGTDEHGMTTYNVVRQLAENTRTNIFDIEDQQAVWRE